jgi:hypothetical protein
MTGRQQRDNLRNTGAPRREPVMDTRATRSQPHVRDQQRGRAWALDEILALVEEGKRRLEEPLFPEERAQIEEVIEQIERSLEGRNKPLIEPLEEVVNLPESQYAASERRRSEPHDRTSWLKTSRRHVHRFFGAFAAGSLIWYLILAYGGRFLDLSFMTGKTALLLNVGRLTIAFVALWATLALSLELVAYRKKMRIEPSSPLR